MITVFTATYNRSHTLPRLYQSLVKQTCLDFEWLLIDDGSQDNTEKLVKQWQQEPNNFPLVYIKQANGGKHRAINKGLNLARGEWFFIVDSDDWLPQNAIQRISTHGQTISQNSHFAGICGFKAKEDGFPLGNCVTLNRTLDASMIDIRKKYHLKGDMAEVFKTAILRQFPFPEFKGENFLNEAAVWNKIAGKYILRYIPEIFYFCEYREDGLTKSIRQKHRNNPKGTMYLYDTVFANPLFGKKQKIRSAILYWRYLIEYKPAYIHAPLWIFLFLPIGLIFYTCDKIKYLYGRKK